MLRKSMPPVGMVFNLGWHALAEHGHVDLHKTFIMKTENGYRKKLRRYDIVGQAHYLTFSCFRNQPFLKSERTCRWFINALIKAKKKA